MDYGPPCCEKNVRFGFKDFRAMIGMTGHMEREISLIEADMIRC